MSDEVPSRRLSQIFDPLTNLKQQPITHYQQQFPANRRRSNSSSPSPSTSGRATPASAGGASNVSGSSSTSSRLHQQYSQQQKNFQYLTQTHNYYHVRAQDGDATAGGYNYLHTFPTTHTPSHLQQHHCMQQQPYQQYNQQHMMHKLPSSSCFQHIQQQQHSLSPLYGTSQSLTASPLLTKRAISFSGQIPLRRQQIESCNANAGNKQYQQVQLMAQSTPSSPRLMAKRQTKPPPIPAKPCSLPSTSSTTSCDSNKSNHREAAVCLNPASSLDGADAPWPHFSTLTDCLDVHQYNNYAQPVPQINWQERCLELQLELHRSKNQASRIRDMLREKICL